MTSITTHGNNSGENLITNIRLPKIFYNHKCNVTEVSQTKYQYHNGTGSINTEATITVLAYKYFAKIFALEILELIRCYSNNFYFTMNQNNNSQHAITAKEHNENNQKQLILV